MADEQEEQAQREREQAREREEQEKQKQRTREEARRKHDDTIGRLRDLRTALDFLVNQIIDNHSSYPSDLEYERQERGYIRDGLVRVQRRIDETIGRLR